MTDESLILQELSDGRWHNIIDIMQNCKPNSRNWAVRSRVSNLRQKGYHIESRIGANRCAEYRLLNPSELASPSKVGNRSDGQDSKLGLVSILGSHPNDAPVPNKLNKARAQAPQFQMDENGQMVMV